MNNDLKAAMKCFKENRLGFTSPKINPVDFNLYHGLTLLIEGVERNHDEVLNHIRVVTKSIEELNDSVAKNKKS